MHSLIADRHLFLQCPVRQENKITITAFKFMLFLSLLKRVITIFRCNHFQNRIKKCSLRVVNNIIHSNVRIEGIDRIDHFSLFIFTVRFSLLSSQVSQAPLGAVNMTLSNSVIVRVCMGKSVVTNETQFSDRQLGSVIIFSIRIYGYNCPIDNLLAVS